MRGPESPVHGAEIAGRRPWPDQATPDVRILGYLFRVIEVQVGVEVHRIIKRAGCNND